MGQFGLTIDGTHTSEYGLRLLSMYIPQPAPKTNFISIPGASGSIDLSEITGQVNYENRSGVEFVFTLMDGSYETWANVTTQLAMRLHGKRLKVIPDNDLNYYYMCRLTVDSKKSNRVMSTVTLSGTAEPFKYDLQASDEEWLWDPFSFESGIIRELSAVVIDNVNKNVLILGGGKPAVPEFIVTQTVNLTLVHSGKTYNMPMPGTYRFPAVKIGEADVTLVFTGTGRMSIRYRGSYL